MSNITNLDPKSIQFWLLKQISYSSRLAQHACPRKYQLNKLHPSGAIDEDSVAGSPHLAFGHAVGAGLQSAFLSNATQDSCMLATYLAWDAAFFTELDKKKKSMWYALNAVEAGYYLAQSLIREGWQVAEFNGVPAVEFSFAVKLPHGFMYRAYVDIILHNPTTGKYRIVEVKTTGSNYVHEAMHANSSQALSYALVLDTMVKEYASYDVLYLIYKSGTMLWEHFPFPKSRQAKAEWIRDVLHDITVIERQFNENYFPKHGESCFAYFTPCKYFGMCGYSDQYLGLENMTYLLKKQEAEQAVKYQIVIDLEDILKQQLLQIERDEHSQDQPIPIPIPLGEPDYEPTPERPDYSTPSRISHISG